MPRIAQHGFTRHLLNVHITNNGLNGTGAVIIQAVKALGFRYRIESAFLAAPGLALTGGNRTVQVKKGTTVLFTLACGNSNFGTAGNVVDMTASVGPESREFSDTDTLAVDIATGGTAVTAGTLNLTLVLRELPQAAA